MTIRSVVQVGFQEKQDALYFHFLPRFVANFNLKSLTENLSDNNHKNINETRQYKSKIVEREMTPTALSIYSTNELRE